MRAGFTVPATDCQHCKPLASPGEVLSTRNQEAHRATVRVDLDRLGNGERVARRPQMGRSGWRRRAGELVERGRVSWRVPVRPLTCSSTS